MPFINISTSVRVGNKKKLLDETSILIASLTNKSKKFVMTKIEDEANLFFDDDSPCCYFEIKSIGSLHPSEMAKPICRFVNDKLGVPLDKIYIFFQDVRPEMWGWNCKTFG